MEVSKQHFSCTDARKIDLVGYLSGLGHKPVKIRRQDYWYLSPLRTENEASFKVNRCINRWYDHGLGMGGNIIDFAIRYHNFSVREFLQSVAQSSRIPNRICTTVDRAEIAKNTIRILSEKSISSLTLIRYLASRNISLEVATQYCREITFELYDKTHHSIGFLNDRGGYELRNSFFKCSSSPKGITTIQNESMSVAVFEGFFDFLSCSVILQNSVNEPMDFCILNSLSFFESARPFLEQHDRIHLFLDNDPAGQNCSRYALTLSARYINENSLYKNHKDLNEWHVQLGKKPPGSPAMNSI